MRSLVSNHMNGREQQKWLDRIDRIEGTVFWQIADAGSFLFNITDPQETVRNVAEAAIHGA